LKLALALSFLCGFVALSHEILWYRVCSYTTAGAAESFALMLAAYLLGISLGALAARRLCRDGEGGVPMRAVCTLLAASALAFFVPPVAAALAVRVELWQLTLPLVAAAAGLLGAVFPLVSHAAVPPDARSGRQVSFLYLANILGSTAGSLITGFWLLDWWPLSKVALALALASLAIAGLAAMLRERPGPGLAAQLAAFGAAAAILVALTPILYGALYEKLQLKSGYRPGYAFSAIVENRSGVIAVSPEGTVYGGGIWDGGFNVSLRNDSNGIARAYAFAGLHPRPREVLMIGLSSGSWAAVIADHPAVEKVTIVEINPGYLKLLPRHSAVAGIPGHPKVSIEIDDGRRWLLRHRERRFDAIISNTTHHWRANISNLLSVEFLQLVRSRLKPGGVLYFNATGSTRAERTAVEIFPHTLGVANLIACSDERLEFDFGRWRRSLENYVVAGERMIRPGSAEDRRLLDALEARLRAGELATDQDLRARSAGLVPITDDNMGTEWTR